MASLDGEALGAVKSTRKALGLPALTLGNALGAVTGKNRKDAERQANINAMVAQLQDSDPANDAAALSGLQGAASSWAGGGKEMAANALRSLNLPATGAALPSVAGGAGGVPAGAAPAPAGGGWLDSVGGTLRRLNGGKALTLGNALGGAAGNVGDALGAVGGFAKDHAGDLLGAGSAYLGVREMGRANQMRDRALGAIPGEAALGLPGSTDVTPGAPVLPGADPRLDRYRSLVDDAAGALSGPSRTDLAMNALSDFDTAQGRAGDAAFRRATQLAAAKGGLGSGMLASSYGDVATDLAEREMAKRNELAYNVAEGDIGDRFRRLDVLGGVEGSAFGQGQATRNEVRGERGHLEGIQEGNITRGLGAAQDVFGRGVARSGIYGGMANATDARGTSLVNAGADLIGGAADRRAYGQVGGAAAPGYAAAQVAGRMAAAPVSTAVGAMRPLGLAAAPAAQPVLQRAATVAAPSAQPAAMPAVATPNVQPMVNMQVPLPPAGPAAVAQPRPLTPTAQATVSPTLRRRRPLLTGGL